MNRFLETGRVLFPSPASADHQIRFSWETSRMRNDTEAFSYLSAPFLSSFAGNKESRLRSSSNLISPQLESRRNSYNSGGFFITNSPDLGSFQLESVSPPSPVDENYTLIANETRMSNKSRCEHGKMDMEEGRRHTITGPKRQKTHDHAENLHHQPSDESAQSVKRRSQKLGDKITALQQLVSPFGKTDTASVLHEATVYIKVLQEQIQVLTTPYVGMKSSSLLQDYEVERFDLRSRGLCLVPVSSTIINLTI